MPTTDRAREDTEPIVAGPSGSSLRDAEREDTNAPINLPPHGGDRGGTEPGTGQEVARTLFRVDSWRLQVPIRDLTRDSTVVAQKTQGALSSPHRSQAPAWGCSG